jgi:hypothetical protein
MSGGRPRTMKIDLIFVGAVLCGRPFEEPTEGLPYNY